MEKLKILIPTDFSVQAEYAYLMVKKLEEKAPIDIHFVHRCLSSISSQKVFQSNEYLLADN